MPLRIARIITRLNVGGPAYQAVILNHLLSQKYNCETLLIYGKTSPGETFYQSLLNRYPCEHIFFPNLQREINPVNDIRAIRQISDEINKFKPDIIHTHTAKAGLLGRTAASFSKFHPLIVHTYHGHVFSNYFSTLKEKFIISAEKLLARKSNCLIAISKQIKTELTEKFHIAPAEKIRIMELGLPLQKFLKLPERGKLRNSLSIPNNAIVLGSLGRLVPIKNYSRMIKAFDLLITRIKNTKNTQQQDIRLIIGGTGPLEHDLRNEIKSRNLTDKIFLIGLVEDLPQFYADIDIGILTSDNEGTPVMLIEAQSAGKFVIAPDVGGISDIIYPQCGRTIRPNTAENYVDALIDIITNWDKYKNIPETIRREIANRFNIYRLTDDIYNLYQNLYQRS